MRVTVECPGTTNAGLFPRMDRIKARQQKYKKGKERMLSLTQEAGDGQDVRNPPEEDDESTFAGSSCPGCRRAAGGGLHLALLLALPASASLTPSVSGDTYLFPLLNE